MKAAVPFRGFTTDLLEVPYSLTQQPLISPEEFCKEAERRGVDLSMGHLEALHRSGHLVPIFYAAELPARYARRADDARFGSTQNLALLAEAHALWDPRQRGYIPWSRLRGRGRPSYAWRTRILFSRVQLLTLPTLQRLMPWIRREHHDNPRLVLRLDTGPRAWPRPLLQPGEIQPLDEVVALHVADTVYLQSVVQTVSYGGGAGKFDTWFAQYYEYLRKANPKTLLKWLGWEASRIEQAAQAISGRASFIDPNRAWLDLMRLVRPAKWSELQGQALMAMDHRIAAETLDLFYDDLVRHRAAPARIIVARRTRPPHPGRLHDDRDQLDPILTAFGLSPHPAVVLVLEGPSDAYLVRQVLRHLDFVYHRSRVEVFSAGGDTKSFDLLAAFTAVPELGQRLPGARIVLLRRPLTRYMVVLDPGRSTTDLQRACVEQIWSQLPKRYKTKASRAEIDGLISVENWGGLGGSMEYANFTDSEIQQALVAAYLKRGVRIPDMRPQIAALRLHNTNIKRLLERRGLPAPHMSKLELAAALWPALRPKVRHDARRSTPILPLVRVAVAAERQARLTVRHSLGLRY